MASLEGDNMMSSSCDYFFFWFCLPKEFNIVWVLRVGDIPVPCTMCVPCENTVVGSIPMIWVSFGY